MVAWLLSILLLPLAVAPGSELSMLGRFELNCPLCAEPFTTVGCVRTNRLGGIDRDTFARAVGPQPVYYLIHTCPRCGFSGYQTDFESSVVIPPDVRTNIRNHLGKLMPEGYGPESDPRELDARDRYRLAIATYSYRHQSDESLAWLHLRASWVARDQGAMLPPDPRLERVMGYIERFRPQPPTDTTNPRDREMALATGLAEALATGHFNRYQKPYAELALLLIYRRHGENRLAQALLDKLHNYPTFSPAIHEALARMADSIADEQQHQQAAADLFERALLSERIAPSNRGAAGYLLGELHRRLGRDTIAARWYQKALKDPALPTDLREWAKEQQQWPLHNP